MFSYCVLLLTGEVDWLLQMHHGDVSLFSYFAVMSVHDDAINFSGLNVHRVGATMRV